MKIDSTILRDFRNLGPNLRVSKTWDSGINLILGRNGAGKTNLLEALSIITGWGAFGKTSSVISWDKKGGRAYISSQFSGEESFAVNAEISSRISLRLNDKSVSFTDLRLYVPSIIFLTGNLSLIDGSPSSRRLFIDRLCALFVPPFAKRLADFKNILRVRSSLLRQGKSPSSTDIPYCKAGGWIMDMRREVLSQLMRMMDTEKFTMRFVPELSFSGEVYLRAMITENRAREVYAQRPLFGPNYDELSIMIMGTGRPASESLSRGQKRRLILYIILTSGRLIEERLKRKPVLLLDDLTAELDAEGREWTYNQLKATGWQAFITAPEKPFATRRKFGGINLNVS
ncbi:MAG: AAA family ATPase [Synergistaceae bacterium]|nr:AAA family ATPase [Synergistaceae bacterium]